MIARRLVPALFCLLHAAWSGAAVQTPPAIPEQPLIRAIYEWDDQIAVITEGYPSAGTAPAGQLYVVDSARAALVAFRGPACDTYHDVAHDARSGKWLLCGSGESARAFRWAKGSWVAASAPVQGKKLRFAVDGERIAIASDQAIFMVAPPSHGQPRSIPLRIGMRPGMAPAALLLIDETLLVAQDVGEFGGGLYLVDLNDASKPPTRLIDDNVAVLARAGSGAVWAAGGLSHLGSVSAALYRISGKRVDVVAAISGFQGLRSGSKVMEKSGVPFPALTSLRGLSLRREGRPTMVFPDLGVFELAGDRFVRLYEGSLSFVYEMPRVRIGSHPVGLAIGPSGDLYVASRSLGVFHLRKAGDRYDLRQLLFDAAGAAR